MDLGVFGGEAMRVGGDGGRVVMVPECQKHGTIILHSHPLTLSLQEPGGGADGVGLTA